MCIFKYWIGAEAVTHPHAISGARLLALANASKSGEPDLPVHLNKIVTPLEREVWERELEEHPDRTFAWHILQGITEGFRVGHDPDLALLLSKERNMLSALEHQEVVSRYLAEELEEGSTSRFPPRSQDMGNTLQPLRGNPQEEEARQIPINPKPISP